MPFLSRLGNGLFRAVLRWLYGFKAHGPFTGLYGLRKTHLEHMQLGSVGFGIEAKIAIKAASMGLRILDMPVDYRERVGRSKLHPFHDGYRILKTIFAFVMLYNPTVTFILPGAAGIVLGIALLGMLLAGPIRISNITLWMHTTMVAGMLALVGFQAIVFGVAAKSYGVAHKLTVPDTVVEIAIRPRVRQILVAVGLACGGLGVVRSLQLVAACPRGGFGDFTQTRKAALISFLVVFGWQLTLSVGFLMVFADDALKRYESSAASMRQGAFPLS